ncbi:hypothetical protein FRC00_000805 [Tulasnella sp. 408]|nr:hypothetical protein FRC00_000805 [Tulasnella sp. 408]
MAGGKPPRPRFRKQKYADDQIAEPVGVEQNGSGSNPANKGERKRHRQRESNSVESSGSSRKKRAKVTVERTGRQSKNAAAILDHDIAQETRSAPTKCSSTINTYVKRPRILGFSSSDADSSSLPEDYEVQPLRSTSVPMTGPQAGSPRDFGDETGLRDSTPRSDGVRLSSRPLSVDGDETSLSEDVERPHPDLWLPFGHIQSLEDPSSSFELRIRNDGSESLDILLQYLTAKYHCRITLQLNQQHDGQLRRRVVVWRGDQAFVVEDKMVLSTGNVIQLGNGDRYLYHGPELSTLYVNIDETPLYGYKGALSTVTQVQRLSDKSACVAKKIVYSHIDLARTEISVYEILGPHPRIVQFIESFYDIESGIHNLIFEAGFMDLNKLALEMRPTGQDVLEISAPKWTRQITEGIAHMHNHGITHRDIKPENILVCLDGSNRLDMKIMDMGLANQNTEPIVEEVSSQSLKTHVAAELVATQWFVGTDKWAAPGPFMVYKEDKYVDCYGIGRVLFFLLTPHEWPQETRKLNRACGCEEECRVECDKRKAAFRVVEKTKAGANPNCLDFMKKLLVAHPKECSTTEEMLKHLYLIKGNRGQK